MLFPDTPSELTRAVTSSSAVRREIQKAQTTGRLYEFMLDGAAYRVYPLKTPSRAASGSTLLVRGLRSADRTGDDSSAWFVLRSIVEADLGAVETLAEERQRSRRLLAMLRFLRFLTEAESEAAVAHALVQAAAVWYDVDARIYRRNLLGDFTLHTWLPAVEPGPDSTNLGAELVGSGQQIVRLPFLEEFADAAGQSALIVPLRGAAAETEWIMALIGAVPAEADAAFEVVGRVAGTQLDLLAGIEADRLRHRIATRLTQDGPPELAVLQAIRELMESTAAATATLTLFHGAASRRLVRIGTAGASSLSAEAEQLFAPDQIVYPLTLAGGFSAVLELRAAEAASFPPAVSRLTEAAAGELGVWLAGVAPSLQEPDQESRGKGAGFERRIQEEMERAKRFDLRLSLILIESAIPLSSAAPIEQALRRELRGSDVLGTLNSHRIAALLIHTNPEGLTHVVQRLRRTLAGTSELLNVPGLLLGQAAFSPDVRTADALVSEAVRQAKPVVALN
ncbi:MAG TPA: hypothetical protein VML55_15545 [Planctomycetaceae bacterium]|nr:hypothetical protein [Planctomycetaceae bacterium]